MKQVLTLVCRLHPTPEQIDLIEATLKAFADACNYITQTVKPNITSAISIQNLAYQPVREQFGLSANLAIRACARVGANRKTAKVKDKHVLAFKPTSADYDARIFVFREQDWTVSLTRRVPAAVPRQPERGGLRLGRRQGTHQVKCW